jgi:hypothetical protein
MVHDLNNGKRKDNLQSMVSLRGLYKKRMFKNEFPIREAFLPFFGRDI